MFQDLYHLLFSCIAAHIITHIRTNIGKKLEIKKSFLVNISQCVDAQLTLSSNKKSMSCIMMTMIKMMMMMMMVMMTVMMMMMMMMILVHNIFIKTIA